MTASSSDGARLGLRAEGGSHVHDVIQVAGDLYQTFVESSPILRAHIRISEFHTLIAERLQTFVGREFVLSAVKEILGKTEFPSGYVLIRGEPGIGKTAVMCHLVRENGYLHHFNIAPQNIRSTRAFLENVCAQLIVRYKLGHTEIPASAGEDSSFLSQLLVEAAASTNEPLVILVDALDEAEDGINGANRLFLPPTLPDRVYFVVSSREQMDYRLAVDRREDIYIRDDDPANLADVRLYVKQFLEHYEERMDGRLVDWTLTPEAFTEEIAERSQGNFMYLVHVLSDIRDGRLDPKSIQDIQNLPRGLQAYYQRHWRTMRNRDAERFERIFEPILRLLAAVREPVSLEYLEELTDLDPARIREVIEQWRPFLNEIAERDERLFRVYHLSFQDFLAVEGMGLKPSHRKIAMRALQKIPGFLSAQDSS
jgi:hypothetical protein